MKSSNTFFLSVVAPMMLTISAAAAQLALETVCDPVKPCLRPLPPPPPRLQPESTPSDVATESATKQVVKQGAKKAAGLGGGIAVDLLWPKPLDYDPAWEDPSSSQFEKDREKLHREAEAQRQSR